MRKLLSLYTNEWIKMQKKASVIIFFALIIIAGLALPGVSKVIALMTGTASQYFQSYPSDTTWMEQESRNSLNYQVSEIERLDGVITDTTASTEMDEDTKSMILQSLEQEKLSNQDYIDVYTMAIDKGIYPDFQYNYVSQSVQKILELKGSIRVDEAAIAEKSSASLETRLATEKECLAGFLDLLDEPDFDTYIALESKRLEVDSYLNDDQKEMQIELLEIRKILQPEGDLVVNSETNHVQSVMSEIEQVKSSVVTGMDSYNGTPLTPDGKKEMIEREMIVDYRLANNCFPTTQNHANRMDAINMAYAGGNFLIIVMMMVLAGSAISQELATGSIKSLIIAPVRRWKIFAAKILALISIGFIVTIAVYVCGMIGQGVFYGFTDNLPYVYVSNGTVMTMPFAIYMLLTVLSSFIEVLFYLILAFMLSVITKNTAVSVALPLGFLFAGSFVKQFSVMLPNLEFLRFVPFNNMDFASRWFPYSNLMTGVMNYDYMMYNTGHTFELPSVSFSLIYLAILAVCMLYTAFDSFTRRDIR